MCDPSGRYSMRCGVMLIGGRLCACGLHVLKCRADTGGLDEMYLHVLWCCANVR